MINSHCGVRLIHIDQNILWHRWRCQVCKRVFKQRKRRSKKRV